MSDLSTYTKRDAFNETLYSVDTLIRINDVNATDEADIDATFDIASSFYFVR